MIDVPKFPTILQQQKKWRLSKGYYAISEIGEMLGVGKKEIHNVLRQLGIRPKLQLRGHQRKFFTKADVAKIKN